MVYDQKIKQLFKELQIPSTDRKVVNEILQPVDEPFIRDYLQDSFGPTHDFSLKCLDCFSIKPRPNSKFIEKQNKKLLWHGTPPANILPILKDGHKLERASKSSLFGPGIYFTDCSTKAANYTSLSEQKFKGGADTGDVVPSFVTSKVGYLFAAEVSLGKTKYLTKTDSTAYLRYTCNSITAWGKYRQTKKKRVNGYWVPLGPLTAEKKVNLAITSSLFTRKLNVEICSSFVSNTFRNKCSYYVFFFKFILVVVLYNKLPSFHRLSKK
ncbi:Poly (ADP ribose) polymerase 1 [Aphelenchoides besseyi]|nr:Poly (ADP ribose) polymerase 1 [Aphelenchoides besseyi]